MSAAFLTFLWTSPCLHRPFSSALFLWLFVYLSIRMENRREEEELNSNEINKRGWNSKNRNCWK